MSVFSLSKAERKSGNPPSLLKEIIDSAIDETQPLAVILRKCPLLAHQLKNDQLKAWANQELNGYEDTEEIPPYRIIPAQAKGNFAGSFGSGCQNWPIPAIALESNHRRMAESVHLIQSVSAYEDAIQNAEVLHFGWNNDFCLFYQKRFFEGRFALVSAWQDVPKCAIVEMLGAIRNRTLNMALEIQSEVGNAEDLSNITESQADQINGTITNHIYGGPNFFASDNSQVTSSVSHSEININAGDRTQLESALKKVGLSETDLRTLRKAVEQDGSEKMGAKVSEWIKTTAPKLLINGAKLGVEIGKPILVECLRRYFGLPPAA